MATFPGKPASSVNSENPSGGKFKPLGATMDGQDGKAGFDRPNNNTVNSEPKPLKKRPS